MTSSEANAPTDFIRKKIADDNTTGKWDGRVVTRFPPEPNGFLHIGHAKSICLNFGVAQENEGGRCHLRMDDTNPLKEETRYVDSMKEDVHWLGFDWGEHFYYASDYFQKLYDYAVQLIKAGKAYVCDLTLEEIRATRGTVTEPGTNSPYRERSVEENLDLFERMKNGEFEDNAKVLRAKIDMSASNMKMRDPVMYRVRNVEHHRTGDSWKIYPIYDYAHCVSDSIEGITHSLCTLEFENNRELYDWYLKELGVYQPEQTEFARLFLSNTVLSKRNLLEMVETNIVDGWDDPRMPTISALRRRGYTPEAIRDFCERIGVARANSVVEYAQLEFSVREDLNKRAHRVMAVLDPLKVTITNYPEGESEELDADNNPEDENAGSRKVPFSGTIYIERADFMEDPPKKYFRLSLGKEVRLKHAYFITCQEVVKNDAGEVIELKCTYDPATRGGSSPDGRKVKGTLHWVSAEHALDAEVRLYEQLFSAHDPGSETGNYKDDLNPNSLVVKKGCKLEPSLKDAKAGVPLQFMRNGYFTADSKDSTADNLVFNRTVGLRDSWAKMQKKKKK